MRMLLLSKADLFGNVNLNRLLAALAPDNEMAVGLSDRVFHNERGFAATDCFMHYTRDLPLERLFPALDAGRAETGGELLTFAGLAGRYGTPLTWLGGNIDAAREATRRLAASFNPDVILCCRHDFIVPPDVFTRAGSGAYNLHSGVVPDYRGPFCSFWSMLCRDEKAGCSIHTLKEKVDSGDIIGTAWAKLDYSAAVAGNLLAIYEAGVRLFLSLAPGLRRGPLAGLPQPRGSGRYYPQPGPGECGEFAAAGGRLATAAESRAILERYLPPGADLDAVIPAWKWGDA